MACRVLLACPVLAAAWLPICMGALARAQPADNASEAGRAAADGRAAEAGRRYEGLGQRLRDRITANAVPLADAGVKIVSVKTGEVILDNYAGKLLVPASNAKLAVTAAALRLLGRDFCFETRLYARGGLLPDGTLDGDLVVAGCGDPEISGRHHEGDPCFLFRAWAKAMKEAGIRAVRGGIVCDASAFDGETIHPSWPKNQLEQWYCAPVSALSLNDNCVDATVGPGRGPGSPASVSLSPPSTYAVVDNHCTTTAAKREHQFGFLGLAGLRPVTLRGKFWQQASPAVTSIPVADPPLYFGTVLKETLQAEGLSVGGKVAVSYDRVPLEKTDALLATHRTPLETALQVANKQSQNFYAEQLLKALGFKASGKGTFATGAAAVKQFLAGVSAGGAQCVPADGSGLSRDNRYSAAVLTDLLCWMARQPDGAVFAATLPAAGIDGTLAERFPEEWCRGRILAKTGTLAGASSLSGYVNVPGDILAFSMLMNSPKAGVWRMKLAQDAILKEILEFCRQLPAAGD